MDETLISPLKESQAAETLELLAKAYLTNPINVAALGTGQSGFRLNKKHFSLMATITPGNVFVAAQNERIVGMLNFIRYPDCLLPRWRQISLIPRLLLNVGSATPRVLKWFSSWNQMHLREPHSHLGPIAVLPEFQRKGIGAKLMEYYCSILDQNAEVGYLETDRYENIKFYDKFGFRVITKFQVLGIPNWSMRRDHQIG